MFHKFLLYGMKIHAHPEKAVEVSFNGRVKEFWIGGNHSVSRIEKRADGSEVEIISPDLPKRAAEICNSLVAVMVMARMVIILVMVMMFVVVTAAGCSCVGSGSASQSSR